MIGEGLPEKATLEQRPGGSEWTISGDIKEGSSRQRDQQVLNKEEQFSLWGVNEWEVHRDQKGDGQILETL